MGVISTIEAKCKDCYRCIRSCPVKAIQFRPGKSGDLAAQVVDQMCIMDGTCVKQCPQNAKRVRDDTGTVKAMLKGKAPVIASLAPSFVAALPLERPFGLIEALKRLGFVSVHETAVGASIVARAHEALVKDGSQMVISTACPVAVNMVEIYYPEAIKYMAPLVSPMTAHAKFLKARYPGSRVVFVGPCFGKKGESDADHHRFVDAVLTFSELWKWLKEAQIDPDLLPEAEFDGPNPRVARLFPIDGGLAATASMETHAGASAVALVSGAEDCTEFLKAVCNGSPVLDGIRVAELLACRGGCVNGPGIISELDPLSRKMRVIRFANEGVARSYGIRAGAKEEEADVVAAASVDLSRELTSRAPELKEPSDEELTDILARTGKITPEDELNCSACGYASCREKAVAVYNGLADIQMCMPYMRSRAESMSNTVVDHLPNAVVIIDHHGRIMEVNATFEKMFSCKAAAISGKPLDGIFDATQYRDVLKSRKAVRLPVAYPEYGIVTEQVIFYIPGQDLAVGLIADITEDERRRDEMFRLKSATMERAQEVIKKQMKVAQEIAGLLGETTAETKVLLSKIIELSRHD